MHQFEEFKTLHETAVWKRLHADPSLKVESMSPISCPVMMEITVDGSPAIFRARHSWWGMYVGIPGSNDVWNIEDNQVFKLEAYYDEDPSAGYMPLERFLLIVEQGITAFRGLQSLMPSRLQKKA